MRGVAELLMGSASVIMMAATMAMAQVADSANWTRFTAGNQAFSVELPCTEAAVAEQGPRLARQRRVDPLAAVGCLHEGRVFIVTQSVLSEQTQPGRSMFDVLRDVAMARNTDNGPTISETLLGSRRVLVSRQLSGSTVAQVNVVEINDRSWLTMIAGGAGNSTLSSQVADEQLERFFASVEVAT